MHCGESRAVFLIFWMSIRTVFLLFVCSLVVQNGQYEWRPLAYLLSLLRTRRRRLRNAKRFYLTTQMSMFAVTLRLVWLAPVRIRLSFGRRYWEHSGKMLRWRR